MPDLSTIVQNLSTLIPMVTALVQFAAAVIGAVFCAQGLYKFYRTLDTAQPERPGTAVLYLLSGITLINLGSSIDVVYDAFFGVEHSSTRNLMSYEGSSRLPENAVLLLKGLILFIQTYGLFFVISGFASMRKLSDNRAAHDITPASVMFRVVGGSLLLNIVLTVNTLAKIAGFGRVL